MRKLSIESTKAGYQRLSWMNDPAGLVVPFDMDTLAPFGIKVIDTNREKDVIQLTYKDKVIGSVGDFVDNAFTLRLAVPESERVDTVIKRIFGIVKDHLETVNRVEKGIIRAEQESPDGIAQRKENARRAHRQTLAQERKEQDRLLALEKSRCGGLEREAGPDPDMVITGFTYEDIEKMSEIQQNNDLISLHTLDPRGRQFVVYAAKGKDWIFSPVEDGEGFTIRNPRKPDTVHLCTPDPEKLGAEMRRILERYERVMRPERIKAALEEIPAARYSTEMFALSDDTAEIHEPVTLNLGEDARVSLQRRDVAVLIDDVVIASWRVPGPEHSGGKMLRRIARVVDQKALEDADLLDKVGSLWITHAMAAVGKDPSVFAMPSIDDIEDDAVSMDMGYRF